MYVCVCVYLDIHTLWFSIDCMIVCMYVCMYVCIYSGKLISFSKTLQMLHPHLPIRLGTWLNLTHEIAVHLPCSHASIASKVWALSPAQLIKFAPYLLVTPAWLIRFGIDRNVPCIVGNFASHIHVDRLCFREMKFIVAPFPGLPTVQFLIACSMQKRREN